MIDALFPKAHKERFKLKYDGIYRAVITSGTDTSLEIARARVRVIGIHNENSSDLPDNLCPWGEIILPKGMDVQYTQGDQVWVMFDNGDPMRPIILGETKFRVAGGPGNSGSTLGQAGSGGYGSSAGAYGNMLPPEEVEIEGIVQQNVNIPDGEKRITNPSDYANENFLFRSGGLENLRGLRIQTVEYFKMLRNFCKTELNTDLLMTAWVKPGRHGNGQAIDAVFTNNHYSYVAGWSDVQNMRGPVYEAYFVAGKYWESLHPDNFWGGRWHKGMSSDYCPIRRDICHWQIELGANRRMEHNKLRVPDKYKPKSNLNEDNEQEVSGKTKIFGRPLKVMNGINDELFYDKFGTGDYGADAMALTTHTDELVTASDMARGAMDSKFQWLHISPSGNVMSLYRDKKMKTNTSFEMGGLKFNVPYNSEDENFNRKKDGGPYMKWGDRVFVPEGFSSSAAEFLNQRSPQNTIGYSHSRTNKVWITPSGNIIQENDIGYGVFDKDHLPWMIKSNGGCIFMIEEGINEEKISMVQSKGSFIQLTDKSIALSSKNKGTYQIDGSQGNLLAEKEINLLSNVNLNIGTENSYVCLSGFADNEQSKTKKYENIHFTGSRGQKYDLVATKDKKIFAQHVDPEENIFQLVFYDMKNLKEDFTHEGHTDPIAYIMINDDKIEFYHKKQIVFNSPDPNHTTNNKDERKEDLENFKKKTENVELLLTDARQHFRHLDWKKGKELIPDGMTNINGEY